jgi:thymidylate kinase
VLLDVPPETIQARRQARGGTAENYEKVELDAKVIELYRRLWDTYGWQRFLPKDDPAEWIMTWLRAGR